MIICYCCVINMICINSGLLLLLIGAKAFCGSIDHAVMVVMIVECWWGWWLDTKVIIVVVAVVVVWTFLLDPQGGCHVLFLSSFRCLVPVCLVWLKAFVVCMGTCCVSRWLLVGVVKSFLLRFAHLCQSGREPKSCFAYAGKFVFRGTFDVLRRVSRTRGERTRDLRWQLRKVQSLPMPDSPIARFWARNKCLICDDG